MSRPECLFCRMAEKRIPSRIIFEDEKVFAVEDINPQAALHALIIPRKHIPTTLDLTPEDDALIGRLFRTANTIAEQKGFAARGFRLVVNTNSDAGQAIFYVHLHLLAGRRMHWPPG